jgi:hypothetical protein
MLVSLPQAGGGSGPPVDSLKRCRACGQLKSITEFSRSTQHSDGVKTVCKACLNLHNIKRPKIEVDYKNCSNQNCPCKNPQPIENFYKHKTGKDGHRQWCKVCYAQNNRKYLVRYNKKHGPRSVHNFNKGSKSRGATGTITHAQWCAMLEYYDNTCLCCGIRGEYTFAGKLTIDHVIPVTKGEIQV